MQPITLTLPGKYWDSQIYMGRLFLFGRDGRLTIIDWDGLIADFSNRHHLSSEFSCAFSNSDYLYLPSGLTWIHHPVIGSHIRERFELLSRTTYAIDPDLMMAHKVFEADSPFPHPHADSLFYNSMLFTVGRSGVYSAFLRRSKSESGLGAMNKRWDAPVVACSAAYGIVALAAGSEGLFEMGANFPFSDIEDDNTFESASVIVNRPCMECSWNFFCVFGHSSQSGSFIAQYELVDNDDNDDESNGGPANIPGSNYFEKKTGKVRRFDRVVDESELFGGHNGYEWAFQDKIYRYLDNQISIRKYNPYSKYEGRKVTDLGSVPVASWKGNLVSAKVALFGIVAEFDNALVVVGSDNSVFNYFSEPVNWRVFPRSQDYRNHLHVIEDDRLLVLSFNGDCFVQQPKKKLGVRFSALGGHGFAR